MHQNGPHVCHGAEQNDSVRTMPQRHAHAMSMHNSQTQREHGAAPHPPRPPTATQLPPIPSGTAPGPALYLPPGCRTGNIAQACCPPALRPGTSSPPAGLQASKRGREYELHGQCARNSQYPQQPSHAPSPACPVPGCDWMTAAQQRLVFVASPSPPPPSHTPPYLRIKQPPKPVAPTNDCSEFTAVNH